MKICYSAESAIDLELNNEFDVKVVPFSFSIDNNLYKDGEITNGEIFSLARKYKTIPKTSAVNINEFIDHFRKLKKEGYDTIVHFSMSSKLSSAYQNAVIASRNFENVYVVDSLSLSSGILLLLLQFKKLIDEGVDLRMALDMIEGIKKDVQVSLIIENLEYIHKGGRCSMIQMLGASLLKIRPMLVLQNGKLEPSKKFMGNYTRCIKEYTKTMLNKYSNPDKELCFINYTSYDPEMVDAVKNELKDIGFKRVIELMTGSTIASHAGESAIGLIYLNK
ncbi:MAG: DegV family EDD domain-containing protein [Gammaproteobacteria bacterium]|nr:DegV family EDD domain-containing protein [Gammaproteobacteria bacterium]